MLATCYTGETLRIRAQDLTHSDDGPVTSGATVTVTVLNADGSTFATGTADTDGIGDDWYVDIAAPETPGIYGVRMTAVVDSATWKGSGAVRVKAF